MILDYKNKYRNNRSLFAVNCLLFVLCIIFSFIDKGYTQQNIKFTHITPKDGLSNSQISCIMQDKEGIIWIGTKMGLNKYDGYKITVYQNEPGNPNSLSCNYIKSIVEDKSGFIWITTWGGGIHKFDKKTETFTNYKHEPNNPKSLPCRFFESIFIDKSDELWAGSFSEGLVRLDKKKGEVISIYKHNKEDPGSISSNRILGSIIEDTKGILWFPAGRLCNFDKKTNKFFTYRFDTKDTSRVSYNNIYDILEDDSTILWLATERGLQKFNKKTGKFKAYENDPLNSQSLSNNMVTCIVKDKSGTLWLGTHGGGLNKFDKKTEKFSVYMNNPREPTSISSDFIGYIDEPGQLIVDNSGTFWIGTENNGVNIYDPFSNKFQIYQNDPFNKESLSDNNVISIFEDNSGILWIGTESWLNKLNLKTGAFSVDKNITNISSIIEDSGGVLWMGCFPFKASHWGLIKYHKNNGKTESFNEGISQGVMYSIFEDNGDIWAGTWTEGLNRFNKKTETFEVYKNKFRDSIPGISANTCLSILNYDSETIWIGTQENGLYKFNKKTKKFIVYRNDPNDPHSLSNNVVKALYKDLSGVLWIGTGVGLNRMIIIPSTEKGKPDKVKFIRYFEKDGLPGNKVCGILGDDHGNFWIATTNGFCRFTAPRVEKAGNKYVLSKPLIRIYDETDGLPCMEFTLAKFKNKNGVMYFGTKKGFIAFHPDSIKDNPFKPPVIITSFKIFNKEVGIYKGPDNYQKSEGEYCPEIIKDGDSYFLPQHISYVKEIILSYKESVFSFDFAALHYAHPEKNQYAYKMEGFDKEWVYSGNKHSATYTNLDPGTYIFRVKGSNCDGVWNEEGTSIKIIITPPWWQTWWFRIAAILFIILAIFVYIKLRIRKLRNDNKILEQKVEERTEELRKNQQQLIESEKKSFIADLVVGLAHDLKTPVGNAMLSSDTILHESKEIEKLIQERSLTQKRLEGYNKKAYDTGELVYAEMQHISEWINGFQMISTDQVRNESKIINLKEYLEACIKTIDFKLRSKKIDCRVNGPDELMVQALPGFISQTLINLINNAVEHGFEDYDIPEKIIEIKIAKEGNKISINCSNNGRPIPQDILPRIFDDYFSTKHGIKGMGLSSVKRIVEQGLGGAIECRSMENGWLEFIIHFPG